MDESIVVNDNLQLLLLYWCLCTGLVVSMYQCSTMPLSFRPSLSVTFLMTKTTTRTEIRDKRRGVTTEPDEIKGRGSRQPRRIGSVCFLSALLLHLCVSSKWELLHQSTTTGLH